MAERIRLRDRSKGALAAAGVALALLAAPTSASAEEYKPTESGHPLRVVAYIVHPVGVALDYLIMRPAWWVGSHEPFRTLFGRTD
jgi:hypothetical protein